MHRSPLSTLVVWLLTVVVSGFFFAFLQLSPTLLDPDGFYHAGLARLVAHGWDGVWSWLPLTVLAHAYADQHWLYHLLVAPLTLVYSPLVAVKAFSAVSAAVAVATIAWVARRLACLTGRQARTGAWLQAVAAVFLIASQPLLFRLNLPKASALAVLLFTLGWWAISERRWYVLGGVVALYPLIHGGWPLLWCVAAVYGFFSFIRWWRAGERPTDIGRLMLTLGGGTALGLLVHPDFPRNLAFFWYQFVQIGLVNYRDVIRVGAEWYSLSLSSLVTTTWLPLLAYFAGLGGTLVTFYRTKKSDSFAAVVIATVLLAATLRSQRFVEYFVPAALFCLVIGLAPWLPRWSLRRGLRQWLGAPLPVATAVTAAGVILLVGFSTLVTVNLWTVAREYRFAGHPFAELASAGQWLQQNAMPGSLVFPSDWDEFPALWYAAPSVRYVSGLDPTFLYAASPTRARLFETLTLGNGTDVGAHIRDDFGAAYVVVTRAGHLDFWQQLERDKNLQPVYADAEATIYQVR